MKLHLYLFTVIIIFVSGCMIVVPGTLYVPQEFQTKQIEMQSLYLSKITPTDNHVGGTALLLIPSEVEIQNNYLQHGNTARRLNKESIDYQINIISNTYLFTADVIRKREIFNSISVDRHNGDPASYSGGEYDFVVYVDVDGWYIKSKNNPRALRVPFDNTKPEGTPRTVSFLDLLSQLARELNVKH